MPTRLRRIPPDTDDMNESRSSWAAVAIVSFLKVCRTDMEDVLADLLCDLMHWSDRHGFNFEKELNRAKMHYEEETRDENN